MRTCSQSSPFLTLLLPFLLLMVPAKAQPVDPLDDEEVDFFVSLDDGLRCDSLESLSGLPGIVVAAKMSLDYHPANGLDEYLFYFSIKDQQGNLMPLNHPVPGVANLHRVVNLSNLPGWVSIQSLSHGRKLMQFRVFFDFLPYQGTHMYTVSYQVLGRELSGQYPVTVSLKRGSDGRFRVRDHCYETVTPGPPRRLGRYPGYSDRLSVSHTPGSSHAYLFLPEEVSTTADIALRDMAGRMVRPVASRPMPSRPGTVELDVANLPAGLYVAQVIDQDRLYSSKFIKR